MKTQRKRAAGNGVPRSPPRPMRDLLLLLPYLSVSVTQDIDYEAAAPDLLVQLADRAETTMRTIHLGMGATGQLLAGSAPEIECREISGDAVEALGWLLAELGEFAAVAQCLAAACRKYTVDYAPQEVEFIPNARP